MSFDSSQVEFEYQVAGRTYRSWTATPDGGGLPFNSEGLPWMAHYKPTRPEIAVLSPQPYQGVSFLVYRIFAGIIVFVHILTEIHSRIAQWRSRRSKTGLSESGCKGE